MIRKAVADDEASIRACAERAYSRYVAAIGRKPAPMVADFASQIVAGKAYVAMDDRHDLKGFIVFFPKENHMFLENIAVSPVFAGRGIGKTLIQFCEEEARRLSLGAVHLYTNEMMTDNLLFYHRLGYTEVERRTEDGFKRVFFKKSLR